MATYSFAPSVNSAVSALENSTNANVFTVPASSYAVFNLYVVGVAGQTVTVLIDGRTILVSTSTTAQTLIGVHAGPSKVVSCTVTGGTPTISFSGVIFTNNA
jgi:hypothetical protein